MKVRTICIIVATLVVAGCGSRKAATPATSHSKYERPPIREVTQQQLDEDSKLIDAIALQQSGRTEEALQSFAQLAHESGTASAWYEMSKILLQRGWTDSAAACIERAVNLMPDNKWYLMQKATVCSQRGDAKGLVDAWKRVVAVCPNQLEYRYELSNAYIMADDVNGAVDALDGVEKMVGVTEEVSLQKQRLWIAVGRTDKAEKELENLSNAMPQDKRYQAMMAQLMMSQKKYSKAKIYYDRVLQADPNDEYIHVQLAEYYKTIGKADKADDEMRLAFANPALDCKTKVQLLAQFYTNEEFYATRSETTFELLETAMRGCDDSAQFALVYGDVLMRQQKYAEAAHWIELSLRQDSSQYEVWEGLLICLSEVPEREHDMLNYAARAERLFPMKTLPLFMQAVSEVRANHHDVALKKLQKAEKWGFLNGYLETDTYGLIAECYYRLGMYDKAWQYFEQCLSIRPDDWGTLNNYAYYLSERGEQLDKAEQMSRRTVEAEPSNANSLDTYGWILHLLGRDKEALRYLRKAVEINPNSDTLKRHLQQVEEVSR